MKITIEYFFDCSRHEPYRASTIVNAYRVVAYDRLSYMEARDRLLRSVKEFLNAPADEEVEL